MTKMFSMCWRDKDRECGDDCIAFRCLGEGNGVAKCQIVVNSLKMVDALQSICETCGGSLYDHQSV